MRRRLTTIAVFGATLHFLSYWACIGFLKATGFQLFSFESIFGFAPAPRHTSIQEIVFVLQGLISYPAAALPFWGDGPVLDFSLLLCNSVFWGVCVAVPIFTLRNRITQRKGAALHAAGNPQ